MLAKDLIIHFSAYEDVPIEVQDDVVPILQAYMPFDLWFWPMPAEVLDTNIYKGMVKVDELIPWNDGTTRRSVEIQYADFLPTCWQRLVCCKELIHYLDPIEQRVSTDPAFQRLVERIVLPVEMYDANDGMSVWNDRLGIWHALAVLFPWACRQLYEAPLRDGKMTLEEIAGEVDLPVEYVAVVMHEDWAHVYHLVVN